MATKAPTKAALLAAAKKIVAAAVKKPVAKKNAMPRKSTKKTPVKRLAKKRKTSGYFPNPAEIAKAHKNDLPFIIQASMLGHPFFTIACVDNMVNAKTIAEALGAKSKATIYRVIRD